MEARNADAEKGARGAAAWRQRVKQLFRRRRPRQRRHLTLFARCCALMSAEVGVNCIVWIIAAIVFKHHRNAVYAEQGNSNDKVLGLALIAWTTGLRHALDADHISAIDNATRRIISVPQHKVSNAGHAILRKRRPVTVGLFFSLGHSTVVFATIVAIAISAGVANGLDTYGDVGGIIGASISGSFLFLIACINSVILYKTWRRLQAIKRRERGQDSGEANPEQRKRHFEGIMTRLAMPLLKSVDRPWKLYPIGVLFGLGFDTASSIALLSISVIGLQTGKSDSTASGNANVVLLALLFTAGMTLVDSADSCLMIYAYAPPRSRHNCSRFALFETENKEGEDEAVDAEQNSADGVIREEGDQQTEKKVKDMDKEPDEATDEIAIDNLSMHPTLQHECKQADIETGEPATGCQTPAQQSQAKYAILSSLDASASRLSLLLTLLSILVAFAISLVVLMGLIGDQCTPCSAAADRQQGSHDGGLAGRWWLAWRRANDNSGYIGAGVVGAFAICVFGYFALRRLKTMARARGLGRDKEPKEPKSEERWPSGCDHGSGVVHGFRTYANPS